MLSLGGQILMNDDGTGRELLLFHCSYLHSDEAWLDTYIRQTHTNLH